MKKGFIIFQIDGLSYDRVKEAINKKEASFLGRLLRGGNFKLEKMYCGIPPLKLQTGIMYGEYRDVPGLTWFNKDEDRFSSVVDINGTKELERKYPDGILKNGASIGTILSGGADGIGSIANLDLPVLLKRFFDYKMVFYILVSPFVLIVDSLFSLLSGMGKGTVFESIFGERILREHTSQLAREKIKGGCPFLYINFIGYDQRSHKTGRNNFLISGIIKKIDKEIEKVYNSAKESELVNYDFFVLADHGQKESIPFRRYFKESFKKVIEKKLGFKIAEGKEFQNKILVRQIEKAVNTIFWLRVISWPFRFIGKRYYLNSQASFRKEVALVFHGELAHVYFNFKKGRVYEEEIEEKFPGFLDSLLKHEGVRFITVISNEGVKILGKEGVIFLNGKERIEGKDPLFDVFDRSYVLNSIKELIETRNSGDIMVLGSELKRKTITFTSDFTCHAGIEKEEQEIFVISPSSSVSFEGTKEPKNLYKFFKSYIK